MGKTAAWLHELLRIQLVSALRTTVAFDVIPQVLQAGHFFRTSITTLWLRSFHRRQPDDPSHLVAANDADRVTAQRSVLPLMAPAVAQGLVGVPSKLVQQRRW